MSAHLLIILGLSRAGGSKEWKNCDPPGAPFGVAQSDSSVRFRPMGLQRTGLDAVRRALERGEAVTALLVRKGAQDPAILEVVEAARAIGAQVIEGPERDLWRMSATAGEHDLLGLVGRDPTASPEAVFRPGIGAVWVLAGLRYPSNIGYVIRTAEVAGAGAVVVQSRLSRRGRRPALRISMGAHRFLPVLWMSAEDALRQARDAGLSRVLLEDDGDLAPWEADLTGDVAIVVGAEDEGVSPSTRALCDVRVRVPMAGFVPSYSVQAPVAAVAYERLRQLQSVLDRQGSG